jgi:hypothetical protein
MSNEQINETYWLGADGKWYPPVAAAASEQPIAGKSRKRVVIGVVVVVALLGAGAALIALGGNKKDESKVVAVSFELRADIESLTSECETSGGYGDINSSTQVIIKGKTGEEIDRSNLGVGLFNSGAGDSRRGCTWLALLEIPKKEDYYVLSVGKRGETTYTWDELDNIQLTLGD